MEPGRNRRRALLLDRDGVINHDHGYVSTIERVAFCDGIFELARRAVDYGYLIAIITNQSGIARGYYTESQFHRLSTWMTGVFAGHGVKLAGIFHCPYLPGATLPDYDRDSFWRKPHPGMILEAARRLDLDLPRSLFVGDQPGDMAAAAAAGVGGRVLIGPDPSATTTAANLIIGQLDQLTDRLTPVRGWQVSGWQVSGWSEPRTLPGR